MLFFFFLVYIVYCFFFFFFSSRRRHTRFDCDWSSDVCSSDLAARASAPCRQRQGLRTQVARWSPPSSAAGSAAAQSGALLSPNGKAREAHRSEERRVGKEWRSQWATYH